MKTYSNHMEYKDVPGRILLKFKDDFFTPGHEQGVESICFSQNKNKSLNKILRNFHSLKINGLFTSLRPKRIIELVERAIKTDPLYLAPNFFSYYTVTCPEGINLRGLLQFVLGLPDVEFAYIESGPMSPPTVNKYYNLLKANQGYLFAAPGGINALHSWNFKGGDGAGNVNFIDIEQGWILDHEDIDFKRFSNSGICKDAFQDHGTSVLGIIMMQDNDIGCIGIAPKTKGGVISQWRPNGIFNTADALMAAIAYLDFGDILLLESQVGDSPESHNMWPIEIQNAIFEVIRLATASGIIVIEPAGNGNLNFGIGKNLDRFRVNEKEIFNFQSPSFRDSGAIIVAAASSNTPHRRIGFSNYGSRINCYAWGEGVVTSGHSPKSFRKAKNVCTINFCGTSCASAIIAGAAIVIQSIAEANLNFRFSPKQMRNILSNNSFGTTSANGLSKDKIGVMPDLKKIIDEIFKHEKRKSTDPARMEKFG